MSLQVLHPFITILHHKYFMYFRLLNENSRSKMMCIAGQFDGSDDAAIVIMEKTPFSDDTAKAILSGSIHHIY